MRRELCKGGGGGLKGGGRRGERRNGEGENGERRREKGGYSECFWVQKGDLHV